jgi:hypothetical protein
MPYTPTRSSANGPEDWLPRIDRALTTLVDRQPSSQSARRAVRAAAVSHSVYCWSYCRCTPDISCGTRGSSARSFTY